MPLEKIQGFKGQGGQVTKKTATKEESDFPKPSPPVPEETDQKGNVSKEDKNLVNDANKVLKKDNNALLVIGGILVAWLLFSCSTTQKTTSAEISISSAEKVVRKMPESSEKTLIQNALFQSKKELKDYSRTTNELSKKKEKAEKIAQSKSETAGKWEGLRNASLFVVFGLFLFFGYKVYQRISGVKLL